MTRRAALRLVLFVTLLVPVSAPADGVPDSVRVQRLAAAGRLWSAVELFHPRVPEQPGAWDSVLVRAVPAIREAGSDSAYVAAVDAMLATLGDPLTRVAGEGVWLPSESDPEPRLRWEPGGLLVVRMNNGADLVTPTAAARFDSLAGHLGRASAVVLDLRRLSGQSAYIEYLWNNSGAGNALVRERVQSPGIRSRAHIGWRGLIATAGSYGSHWRVADGLRITPTTFGPPIRVIALVNADSWIPPVVFALQARGTAAVICEGVFSDGQSGATSSIPLGEGRWARVRIGELVMPDGSRAQPDSVLTTSGASNPDAALQIAIAIAGRGAPLPRAKPAAAAPLPPARPVPNPYAALRSPALPWRMLAAYRIWNRVEYFAAYRHLLGDRWDRAFEAAIPAFEAAEDSTAYALAVARFYKGMEDTHGFINSSALRAWIGNATLPVRVRQIEGRPVVTSFTDAAAARDAGLEIGDQILAVDGEDAAARRARIAGVVCVSNDSQRDYYSALQLLQGADSSMAVVRVRDGKGRIAERRGRRSAAYFRNAARERTGPVWKVLPGNLGYVDLERLAPTQVDSMFTALAGTRGLIFDMRGYPQGTGWSIAPRLTERTGVIGATFRTPIAYRPRSTDFRIDEQEIFDQPIAGPPASKYLAPTVMLVDERTISQAEHTGLFFSAFNGTTFVGSQTAGANGDVTTFTIPGDIRLTLSGHDVRHADGRQLQQVGLPITVPARPTIAGLRAGRDEVLDAGVRHLEQRIAAAKKAPRAARAVGAGGASRGAETR
jgi:C-terminal processing protease CtpA/Prc